MTAMPIKIALRFLLTTCAFAASVSVASQTTDAFVQGEGKETVQATCTRCHSATLVTQNSGSEDVWRIRVRLMQASHGMPAIDEATESTIVSYLATHYGQKTAARRAVLKPEFMPTNPYAQEPAAD